MRRTSGPSKAWLKIKNPNAPAAMRIIEGGLWPNRTKLDGLTHPFASFCFGVIHLQRNMIPGIRV